MCSSHCGLGRLARRSPGCEKVVSGRRTTACEGLASSDAATRPIADGSVCALGGSVVSALANRLPRAIVLFSVVLGFAAAILSCDKIRGKGGGSAGTSSSAAAASGAAATSGASAATKSSASAGSGDCLAGTWNCSLTDSTVAMTITGTAISAMVTAGPMTMDVTAKFTLDGNKFSVEDTGGKLACKPGVIGSYTYTCSATQLSFKKISDACDGRAKYLACNFSK